MPSTEAADLCFTHFLPDAAAGEEFLVTALTDRGERWLDDNAALPDEDGNARVASGAEFHQLFKQAKGDGLLVVHGDAEAQDGMAALEVLNSLVASGRFRVAVIKQGLLKVVHKQGPGELVLTRVAEDGGNAAVFRAPKPRFH